MKDRGMKKWAPYASLIEQKETVHQMKSKREKIAKPLLSQEQAEEINQQLLSLKKGDWIKLEYFFNGLVTRLEGQLRQINLDQKFLIVDNQKLHFTDLTNLF
jgi:type IV secretory pathway VirB9-like protein